MICAISSGLSPSRSNLKVTIFLLCVSSWHSATLSPTLEICKAFIQVNCFVTKSLNMTEFIRWNPYTENIKLGSCGLLVAGATAHGSALVTFQWAPLVATAWCRASVVAVTKTWRCIWQAAETEMDTWERDWTHCTHAFLKITSFSPFYRWWHQSSGNCWLLHWCWLRNTHRGLKHKTFINQGPDLKMESPIVCASHFWNDLELYLVIYNQTFTGKKLFKPETIHQTELFNLVKFISG